MIHTRKGCGVQIRDRKLFMGWDGCGQNIGCDNMKHLIILIWHSYTGK